MTLTEPSPANLATSAASQAWRHASPTAWVLTRLLARLDAACSVSHTLTALASATLTVPSTKAAATQDGTYATATVSPSVNSTMTSSFVVPAVLALV